MLSTNCSVLIWNDHHKLVDRRGHHFYWDSRCKIQNQIAVIVKLSKSLPTIYVVWYRPVNTCQHSLCSSQQSYKSVQDGRILYHRSVASKESLQALIPWKIFLPRPCLVPQFSFHASHTWRDLVHTLAHGNKLTPAPKYLLSPLKYQNHQFHNPCLECNSHHYYPRDIYPPQISLHPEFNTNKDTSNEFSSK